jgi:MFS family permease
MVFESLRRFPRTFKVLVASALIENIAFGLIIPYLTLYMMFDIGISEVLTGIVLMTYTVAGVPAMIIGGMLADKIGRRPVLLASLGLMSITMLMYFFAYDFRTLVILAFADAFVGSMYMPAANAMIADMIRPADRPKAFSTMRIAWNVGIVLGPSIGAALVAASSMGILFVFGAAILAGAFVMNFVLIRETKPADAKPEDITFMKVMGVAKDHPFLLLCALTAVLWFCFAQWMSVLPVYATLDLGLEDYEWGLMFTVSSLMVVATQLPVTGYVVRFRRSSVLMAGHMTVALGFVLIFLAFDFWTLLACIVVITIGEILYMSILSTVIADMAPSSKRGSYMGFSGFVQTLGNGIGFLLGMVLLSVMSEASMIWIVIGAIGFATGLGYILFASIVGPEHNDPKVIESNRIMALADDCE